MANWNWNDDHVYPHFERLLDISLHNRSFVAIAAGFHDEPRNDRFDAAAMIPIEQWGRITQLVIAAADRMGAELYPRGTDPANRSRWQISLPSEHPVVERRPNGAVELVVRCGLVDLVTRLEKPRAQRLAKEIAAASR